VCGRFAFYSPHEAVRALFGIALPGPDTPRYNLAPTQAVPVLRAGAGGTPEGAWLRWGLVPSWAKDPAIGNRLINARVETVAEKPAFRGAFRQQRCVVLADGFYEWQQRPGGKQPHFIAPAAGGLLALAGLWELWQPPGGDALETCTIITTAATGAAAGVHDRMPLTVPPALLATWLTAPPATALAAVVGATPVALAAVPVSRAVNDPHHDGPELLRPVADS
jgi:putative SOS response-associated peptidase YedK